MERIEKTVFLSYRRTNIPWALAIFQNLTQHGYDVFFDYNGIASGDFERVILGNITARAHFLVLLTPSALERCDEPADWLRREIEAALANQRNIVPLMLEGFDFGTPKIASQLTGTLAALKRYNGLSIPPEYFLEAMERLRGRYVPLTAGLHPASLPAQRAATEQKAAADAAPAVQEEELTAQQWAERGFAAAGVEEQLRFYGAAIRLKPDYAEAFDNRGVARDQKGDVEGELRDYNEPSGSSQTMPTLFTTGELRAATKATWRARCRITTKPSGSSRTMPTLSSTGALRAAKKGTWRARCRITTKPSGSRRTTPTPSATGAMRAAPRATWRARCRITAKPSGLSRTLPSPSSTGAMRGAPKATWRARCKTTTRPSGSSRTMPSLSTTGAMRAAPKATQRDRKS